MATLKQLTVFLECITVLPLTIIRPPEHNNSLLDLTFILLHQRVFIKVTFLRNYWSNEQLKKHPSTKLDNHNPDQSFGDTWVIYSNCNQTLTTGSWILQREKRTCLRPCFARTLISTNVNWNFMGFKIRIKGIATNSQRHRFFARTRAKLADWILDAWFRKGHLLSS